MIFFPRSGGNWHRNKRKCIPFRIDLLNTSCHAELCAVACLKHIGNLKQRHKFACFSDTWSWTIFFLSIFRRPAVVTIMLHLPPLHLYIYHQYECGQLRSIILCLRFCWTSPKLQGKNVPSSTTTLLTLIDWGQIKEVQIKRSLDSFLIRPFS